MWSREFPLQGLWEDDAPFGGDALIVEVSVCVKPEAGEGNCRHAATSCLCCRPERSVKVPPVGGDAVQFRQRVNWQKANRFPLRQLRRGRSGSGIDTFGEAAG